MFENLDLTVFIYVGAIALLMLANTALGVAKANKLDQFSWKTFLNGLAKYLLILLAVIFIFGAGVLLPDFKVMLPINEESITIIQMISLLAAAVAIKYVKSCLDNFTEIMQINEELKDKTVKETQKEEYLG